MAKRASVYMLRVTSGYAAPGTWVCNGRDGVSFEAAASDGTSWPSREYAQRAKRLMRAGGTRTEIVRFEEVAR